MNSRTLVITAIILIAIISTVGWAYYDKRKDDKARLAAEQQNAQQEKKVSNLTNLDPTDFDDVVKKEYALSNEKALQADPNRKLCAIVVEIGKNLTPEVVNTRYVFAKQGETDNWMITISEVSKNYIRALIPKSDYLGDLPEINSKLWKYNFVTALQLAEKEGGLSWREKNTLNGITLTLRHTGANNWLLWIVEYKGENGNFTLKLDANSGKVVTE